MIFITILIDPTLTSRKNDIFNLSVCLNDCHKKNQQTQENYKKNVYCVYQFAFIWCFFHHCSSIVLRQLFLQEIWKYIDLNGDVTKWQIIFIVSRVKLIVYYTSFFIHEGYLVRFLFISRTVTQRRLKQV